MSRSAVENIEAGEIRSISKNKHTRVKLNKTSVSSNELEEGKRSCFARSLFLETNDRLVEEERTRLRRLYWGYSREPRLFHAQRFERGEGGT